MKFERRTDRFEIGDVVEFIYEDPYDGFFMAERHREKHGRGPYTVEDIEPAGLPWSRDECLHPQLIYVDGHRYSGAWFKPLRPAEGQVAA